jgi:hypothetical protein
MKFLNRKSGRMVDRLGLGAGRSRLACAGLAAALSLGGTAGIVLTNSTAGGAASVLKTALINGDSVRLFNGITNGSGDPVSLEQFAAEKAGYTVTVVDGPTWTAMTAADFAKYQVLVIGDPNCGFTSGSAVGNAAVWAPVVMGTAGTGTLVGNRVVVGTDPEFHYSGSPGASPTDPTDPTTAGAEHLAQSGITYAGGVSGATGVYFDTSCADPGSDVAILNSLSQSGAGWTEDTSPPCGGNVALIAANPVFNSVTDTDLQGWSCSVHMTWPTFPADWQALAVATDTATKPTCGTDPITHTTECGEAYVLVAGEGIVVAAPDLALAPLTSSGPAGGTHTVTATVTTGGSALANQLVGFDVTGQNAGVTGTCVPATCKTDALGKVTFTYSDVNGAGTDTINATTTIDGTTEHANASRTWTDEGGGSTTTTSTSTTTTTIARDITPPTCVLSGALVGPPKAIQITTSDGGSGLASIVVTTTTNASTPVPAFTVGTKGAVVVTATKINQSKASTVALRVTDVAGNITNCDPTLVTLSGNSSETVTGVPAIEHYVNVKSSGLAVTVTVNGQAFSAGNGTIDVGSAINAGSGNTIGISGSGSGSADVLIWDGTGTP